MENKSLSFKIITSIAILIALILFSCIYCITMINKTQTYAQDTGTNWMPSIEAFTQINTLVGNISRRHLYIITNSLGNQTQFIPKQVEGLLKFKEDLDKAFKDYELKFISPGEQSFYDTTFAAYNNFIKSMEKEQLLIKQNNPKEALKQFTEDGNKNLFKLIEDINKEVQFNSDGAINSTKQGANLTSITNWTMTIVITFSIIISLIIIIIIMRLTSTIKLAIEELKKQGDSTMKISKTLMHSSQSLSESATE